VAREEDCRAALLFVELFLLLVLVLVLVLFPPPALALCFLPLAL